MTGAMRLSDIHHFPLLAIIRPSPPTPPLAPLLRSRHLAHQLCGYQLLLRSRLNHSHSEAPRRAPREAQKEPPNGRIFFL